MHKTFYVSLIQRPPSELRNNGWTTAKFLSATIAWNFVLGREVLALNIKLSDKKATIEFRGLMHALFSHNLPYLERIPLLIWSGTYVFLWAARLDVSSTDVMPGRIMNVGGITGLYLALFPLQGEDSGVDLSSIWFY